MKTKMKQLTKILFLLIFITLWNCQKDDFNEEVNNKNNLKVSHIKYEDIKSNSKISSKVDKFNKINLNTQAKLINVNQHGFYINTDDVIYIEDNNTHSYTFNIYRDSISQFVENLVLKPNDAGDYDSFLVKYDFSEQDIAMSNSGQLVPNQNSKTSIQKIENIDSNLMFKSNENQTEGGPFSLPNGCAWELIDSEYAETPLENGYIYYEVVNYYTINCNGGGSSSGSGDGGNNGGWSGSGNTGGESSGTGSNSNGTGTSSNNNPIITKPNITLTNLDGTNATINYLTNLLSLNNQQTTWLNHNLETANQFLNLLNENNNSNETKEFVKELIDLAVEKNITFTFDNTINENNSLSFLTINEFEQHLINEEYIAENINLEVLNQNERIAKFNFSAGLFSINAFIKQTVHPTYSITSVNTSKSGLTIFYDWEQIDYSVNLGSGSISTVDIYGKSTQGIKIGGFTGLTVESIVHFRISLDKNTGQIITANRIDD